MLTRQHALGPEGSAFPCESTVSAIVVVKLVNCFEESTREVKQCSFQVYCCYGSRVISGQERKWEVPLWTVYIALSEQLLACLFYGYRSYTCLKPCSSHAFCTSSLHSGATDTCLNVERKNSGIAILKQENLVLTPNRGVPLVSGSASCPWLLQIVQMHWCTVAISPLLGRCIGSSWYSWALNKE